MINFKNTEADVCNARRLNHNGGYNCSGDTEGFSCSVYCPDGVQFEYPPSPLYRCLYETGVFIPRPVPRCLYGTNIQLIPLGGSPQTLHGKHSYGAPPFEVGDLTAPFVSNKGIKKAGKSEKMLDVEMLLPKPASCFTWAGIHYKTFDGKVYR